MFEKSSVANYSHALPSLLTLHLSSLPSSLSLQLLQPSFPLFTHSFLSIIFSFFLFVSRTFYFSTFCLSYSMISLLNSFSISWHFSPLPLYSCIFLSFLHFFSSEKILSFCFKRHKLPLTQISLYCSFDLSHTFILSKFLTFLSFKVPFSSDICFFFLSD